MVGNSSSGIVEASSFQLPVVNVGTRQRRQGPCAKCYRCWVRPGQKFSQGFSRPWSRNSVLRLKGLVNPYGNGDASSVIVDHLKNVALGDTLIRKKFYDMPLIRNTAVDKEMKQPTSRSDHWEIGSEFHWMGLPPAPFVPWPEPASWYLLGRHAVVDLLRNLPAISRRLWLPSYFCHDVVDFWRVSLRS